MKDNAAHLLLGALKVTPPEWHPPQPFHGGGPPPKIGARAYVIGGVWLAERVSPLVDPRDRKVFDAHLTLAKAQLTAGVEDTSRRTKLYAADAKKASRVPCKIGIWAAHEASNWVFKPIYAGGAARPAAANFARLLVKEHPDDVAAYLVALDAICIHLEAITVLQDRSKVPSSPPRTTLWRGHKDGKVTHWLMRLENGQLALLAKVGTRWHLHEGTRDDVLANVSDDQFENAVTAALRDG
jgi:hypothetical protein